MLYEYYYIIYFYDDILTLKLYFAQLVLTQDYNHFVNNDLNSMLFSF